MSPNVKGSAAAQQRSVRRERKRVTGREGDSVTAYDRTHDGRATPVSKSTELRSACPRRRTSETRRNPESPLEQQHVVSNPDRSPTASTGSVAQQRVLWRLHQTRLLTAARLSDGCDNLSQRSSHSNRRAEGCTRFWQQPCSWYGCDTQL